MRVFESQERRTAPRRAVPPPRRRPAPERSGSAAFSAMGRPATRRGFRRHGLRCLGMLGVGAGFWAATGAVIELVPHVDGAPVQVLCLGLVSSGAVVVAGGLAALGAWTRMGWVLRTHPWTVLECAPADSTSGGRATSLEVGPHGEHRLTLLTYGTIPAGFADARSVWLAGSPERGGVVSADGGEHLVWCRPAPAN